MILDLQLVSIKNALNRFFSLLVVQPFLTLEDNNGNWSLYGNKKTKINKLEDYLKGTIAPRDIYNIKQYRGYLNKDFFYLSLNHI